jgi:hypothetical protein
MTELDEQFFFMCQARKLRGVYNDEGPTFLRGITMK